MIIIVLTYFKCLKGIFHYDSDFISRIQSKNIYVNGNFELIEMLVKNSPANETQELVLHSNPNVVYTVLKCEYAHCIANILQSYYVIYTYGLKEFDDDKKTDTYDSSNMYDNKATSEDFNLKDDFFITVTDNFMDIREYVVQIIYTLFYISDNIQGLRTNDVSLLKTLLTINLFLNYSLEARLKNIDNLNKSIYNMIGLINRFRFRKCEVKEPNINITQVDELINDKTRKIYDIISIILEPYESRLSPLMRVKGVDYSFDSFSIEMYDSEVFLMEHLLQYHLDNRMVLGNINISYESKIYLLENLYAKTIRTYSIDRILEYQVILFDVITDLFYRRIHDLLINAYNEGSLDLLKDLQVNFNRFIYEIIPRVCLKYTSKNVISMKLLLDDALKHYETNNNVQIFKLIQEKFKFKLRNEFIYPNTLQKTV